MTVPPTPTSNSRWSKSHSRLPRSTHAMHYSQDLHRFTDLCCTAQKQKTVKKPTVTVAEIQERMQKAEAQGEKLDFRCVV